MEPVSECPECTGTGVKYSIGNRVNPSRQIDCHGCGGTGQRLQARDFQGFPDFDPYREGWEAARASHPDMEALAERYYRALRTLANPDGDAYMKDPWVARMANYAREVLAG